MQSSDSKVIAVGITNSKASQRAVAYAATQIAKPGDTVHLLCVLLDSTLADDHFARTTYMRIQRIIAERFLPILDDVFVQHKTHILRTTAISGGVSCIAGILGSKSVELNASVLVVGNGTSTYLSELLFPSVAKAVLKLKRVPIAIVGADAVRHCGAGERAGEVEPWEGGCVLQVDSSKLQRLSLARGGAAAARDRLLTRASAPSVQSSLHACNRAWPGGPVSPAESMLRASSAQPLSRSSGLSAERLGTSSAIPEVAEEQPQSSHQQESTPQDSCQRGPRDSSQRGLGNSSQRSLRESPSESWVRLQPQALPDEDLGEPGGSSSTSRRPMLPRMVVSRVQ